ncbi:PTI1-like tyrosine-protein kinase At3g15890 [Tasmannia lanceolata]|uniref:PTI1-like tyrosine-protein kinase At3g15890 n=1 Tax=Tasmannia lanceolata TaxID=3420 RepID=UPI0040647E7D
MAIKANISQSIFLDPIQANDCIDMFQGLHTQMNLSNCRLQDFISSSSPMSMCSRNVNSIVGSLGIDRFNVLQSKCGNLSMGQYSNDACFSCLDSYRKSLQALKEGNGEGGGDPWSGSVCSQSLLVALASSNAGSVNWVQGIFSCLWEEISFTWPTEKHGQGKGLLMGPKILLVSTIMVALFLVVLAPILYKITNKRLRDSSQKDIENLSVAVMKSLTDDCATASPFTFSGLYMFSQEEISKATNNFNIYNLIGEGTLGQVYIGMMRSGQKVAVKRIKKEMKLQGFSDAIRKVAKVKHPNLVSTLDYCDRGEQWLVYDYCVNGNLESWLLGNRKSNALTWKQRLWIAIGTAQGLWFLQKNPLEKMIHGNLKLTNILLNEKLEAKLSDYGLSNCKNGITNGLLDNDLATKPCDVFSFGVVLLQLLTGRKTVDFSASGSRYLVNEARDMVFKGGNPCALADPRLNGSYNSVAFQRVLLMGVLCTAASECERPSLEETLLKLQEAHAFS